MSRRLVEAGARYVTVGWDMAVRGDDTTSWDSHRELTRINRDYLLPGLDRSLPPFLLDLEERGMLEDTLVLVCGEIGRTPRFLNRGSADGRDHWSYCFPALITALVFSKEPFMASPTNMLPTRSPTLFHRRILRQLSMIVWESTLKLGFPALKDGRFQ